jgi:hypothetical protein
MLELFANDYMHTSGKRGHSQTFTFAAKFGIDTLFILWNIIHSINKFVHTDQVFFLTEYKTNSTVLDLH